MSGIYWKGEYFSLKDFTALNLQDEHPSILKAQEISYDFISGKAEFEFKSSGSSGEPKSLFFGLEAIKASSLRTLHYLEINGPYPIFWVALDCRYTGGLMMLLRALITQSDILLSAPDSSGLLNTVIPKNKELWVALAPIQLPVLFERTDFTSLETQLIRILLGGQAISPQVDELAQRIKTPIFLGYGMTETLSNIAIRRVNGENKSDRFYPYDGVKIWKSYNGRYKISDPISNDDGVLTYDELNLFKDGGFQIIGRADSIINSGAIKVPAELVEHECLKIFKDYNLAVIGYPDYLFGEVVTLVFEGKKPPTMELGKGMAELKLVLRPYWVPKRIEVIPQIPLTITGKPQRKLLLATLLSINNLS